MTNVSIKKATGENDVGVPVFDEANQLVYIPQTALSELNSKRSQLEHSYSKWLRHRIATITKIYDIAETLRVKQKKISGMSIGTSVAGLAGGALTLMSIAFPPVAFAGIAVCTASGVTGIALDLAERDDIKKSTSEVEQLIELDITYMKQLIADSNELIDYFGRYMTLKDCSVDSLSTKIIATRGILKGITMITNIRSAVCITRTIGKSVLRVTAAAGMILDGLRLITSTNALERKSDLVVNLEQFASGLEQEKDVISSNYEELSGKNDNNSQ